MMGITVPFFFNMRFGAQFTSYLDRSFDISIDDTINLEGQSFNVTDRIRSDGGVSEIMITLARIVHPRLQIGGSLHGMVGSSRVRVTREFEDSAFVPFAQTSTLSFKGLGVSVGAFAVPVDDVAVSAYARTDDQLKTSQDNVRIGGANLPITVGGGIMLRASSAIRVASQFEWQSWSDASRAVDALAFNTYEVSGGIELGSGTRVFRLGSRYAKLPFGPTEQPTEFDLATGFGLTFSGGRGLIDVALERAWRKGDGVTEAVWNVVAGLTVRP
jgi:hypothetical protein